MEGQFDKIAVDEAKARPAKSRWDLVDRRRQFVEGRRDCWLFAVVGDTATVCQSACAKSVLDRPKRSASYPEHQEIPL